jgi:integrase
VIDLGRDASGKRKQKWHTVHGGKRDAQRELTRLLNELNTGSYVEPAKLTVARYLEKWLTDYAKPKVEGTTYDGYRVIVDKHLVPALGMLPLPKLQPLHIQNYYAEAQRTGRRDGRGGLSALTVRHHHRLLHTALEQAVRWQLLPRNPAAGVEPPRPKEEEMQVLDADGMRKLLEAAEGTNLHVPILLAVGTGLRRGEILGLRWQDLNLPAGTLTVQQSLEETSEGLAFKAPKTKCSRRTIHLPLVVTEALVRHRAAQAAHRLQVGAAYEDQSLVIAWEDGRPYRPHYVTLAFTRLVKKHGLTVRFHDLRHSQATALIALGEHMKTISSRLGHSSIQITMDRYGHLLPGMDQAAAARFDGLLRGETAAAEHALGA